jgi:hypothetical protein
VQTVKHHREELQKGQHTSNLAESLSNCLAWSAFVNSDFLGHPEKYSAFRIKGYLRRWHHLEIISNNIFIDKLALKYAIYVI